MKILVKKLLNSFGLEISTLRGKQLLDYKNEIQKLRDIGLHPFKSIIDIGANTGQFAAHARVAFPDADIISFEPIEACYTKLQERFRGDKKFKAYNYAIGRSSRQTTFYDNNYSPSSSMLAIDSSHIEFFPKTANTKPIVVEERMFDEVVDIAELAKPCLLKIDVQGYEMEVISNNNKLLAAADSVIIETSFIQLYKEQPLFDNVYQAMVKLGFEYRGSYEQLYAPGSYRAIQSDSIFLKP